MRSIKRRVFGAVTDLNDWVVESIYRLVIIKVIFYIQSNTILHIPDLNILRFIAHKRGTI